MWAHVVWGYMVIGVSLWTNIRIKSNNLVRWKVNDVACLHVEINHVVGGSYLDIEDFRSRKYTISRVEVQNIMFKS
jgi:hypothetical protein